MSNNEANLLVCLNCDSINLQQSYQCYRCDKQLTQDGNKRLEISWALLMTAIIAYCFANIYPILITQQFNDTISNTIIGGIFALWHNGSQPIAVIVFVASIFIPIVKFTLLFYLLITVKKLSKDDNKDKHYLFYNMAKLVGPWSMIDVFVVAILSTLVNVTNVQILPGLGANAFAVSVLLMLLSAQAFDVRLINYLPEAEQLK